MMIVKKTRFGSQDSFIVMLFALVRNHSIQVKLNGRPMVTNVLNGATICERRIQAGIINIQNV